MSYLHIDNLYKDQRVLEFKEIFCLEKIHGTSAHVSFDKDINTGKVSLEFFPGGVGYEEFVALFDKEQLIKVFNEVYDGQKLTINGEAYGGKCQKMSDTYGKELKFVAFDVRIGESWLNVPNAEQVCQKFNIEFVHYVKIPTDMDLINKEMERDSEQGIRNGCGPGHPSEGIVIRPTIECYTNSGKRVICKHKKPEFRETRQIKNMVNLEQLEKMKNAEAIATDWCTEMRLQHVSDAIQKPIDVENIKYFIPAMIEDIKRESEGEVEWSKTVEKSIGQHTAKMIKNLMKSKL